jgi:probable F420-dependent oxidoreductase
VPLLFGLQSSASDLHRVLDDAKRAESAGFDVFQVGDHIGTEFAPLAALTAAAAVTERIRLGTLVLNNDLRHPVVLAQELATLDHVCGGRLEVGLGAGHSFTEYAAAGIPFDPPAVRKERLAESVAIIRALLDGSPVSVQGRHYSLEHATVLRPRQEHVPLLVGVNGRAALARAAELADVVALTMLGRTLPDGQRHEVRWEAARLDETVGWIRDSAATHGRSVPLHALVQAVVVTEDRTRAAEEFAQRHGMAPSDALATPFLCLGTHEEMADHLRACRKRWGIEYFSVRSIEDFEPVMGRLRAADGGVT